MLTKQHIKKRVLDLIGVQLINHYSGRAIKYEPMGLNRESNRNLQLTCELTWTDAEQASHR